MRATFNEEIFKNLITRLGFPLYPENLEKLTTYLDKSWNFVIFEKYIGKMV